MIYWLKKKKIFCRYRNSVTENLQHIAIIMDGNGRWAKKKGLPRSAGHKKGAETLQKIAEAAADEGVKYLTVYAFSTENWKRDKTEVEYLMTLLREYLKTGFEELQKRGARSRSLKILSSRWISLKKKPPKTTN